MKKAMVGSLEHKTILTILARLLSDLILLQLHRVCCRCQYAMLTSSCILSAFDSSDSIPPVIPNQLCPPLDEALHLLMLLVLIHLLLSLIGVI